MELYDHQKEALKATEQFNHTAYYLDMGLGKTFVGSEKVEDLKATINLIICQKSKLNDWIEHFRTYYSYVPQFTYDLTDPKQLKAFSKHASFIGSDGEACYGIINYDLAWRRKELLQLKDFTLMLDESSLIQNENSKRSSFILKLKPKNVILLSGTPCAGKYENLWSQLHLLGWKISKELYYNTYVDFHWDDSQGFPLRIIDGYKNVERLKRKMREHGCYFLKTEEVLDLPDQIDQSIKVPITKDYLKFKRDRMVTVEDTELIGDTLLTKMLYERELCGQYNQDKLKAFLDLVESTSDRLIVFYNFNAELEKLWDIAKECNRPVSMVNGTVKTLDNYETEDNSITFIQYQAGSMGLNLQKANKIIYFTPPLNSEFYEQSRKRTHRLGQNNTCFYYQMICQWSIEERIYKTLAKRKDYTEALFENED